MNILGISAFYHDSAATILVDGEIIAAAQEERFTRKKHDPSFPINAIEYCLEESGLTLNDIDAVAFYDKPFLKFERLIETYYAFAPKGIRSFINSIPVWIKEKLFLKRIIRQELKKIGDNSNVQLLFPEHHLSHAASAFYPSNFESAAILTIDGVGEWATASICHGKGSSITVLKELKFPHSIGLLYSAFTYFLGFKVNSGEYKLMGLAPYGNSGKKLDRIIETIKSELIQIYDDGSIWLNQRYFSYSTGLKMVPDRKWENLFGIPKRTPESEIRQEHCDLALAIQRVTEEVVLKMAMEAQKLTKEKNICLAGGVALNGVANGKLESANLFEKIFIQPAAGDAGGSLGASLASHYIKFERPRKTIQGRDLMKGSLLGPQYSDDEIKIKLTDLSATFKVVSDDVLMMETSKSIADGKVIGWFQGRMEFGPRALGNRSILADPRNPGMQKKLNLSIKYRESFRPFAPSVTKHRASDYFDLKGDSPYMLLVKPISNDIKIEVPSDFDQLELNQKLYIERSNLPAITHVDYSTRIQTVDKETNPRYFELIEAFERETGCPVLINTSFNLRGEPIVNTIEDAYNCFMNSEMDILVINNFILQKTEQPESPLIKPENISLVLD
ncbi:MAG: carbamoyltransferase [bacterium]|nr:carbamoyltransferase [bacterium]